jgi:hypothetical protein
MSYRLQRHKINRYVMDIENIYLGYRVREYGKRSTKNSCALLSQTFVGAKTGRDLVRERETSEGRNKKDRRRPDHQSQSKKKSSSCTTGLLGGWGWPLFLTTGLSFLTVFYHLCPTSLHQSSPVFPGSPSYRLSTNVGENVPSSNSCCCLFQKYPTVASQHDWINSERRRNTSPQDTLLIVTTIILHQALIKISRPKGPINACAIPNSDPHKNLLALFQFPAGYRT